MKQDPNSAGARLARQRAREWKIKNEGEQVPEEPKSKAEFVEMVSQRLAEGWGVYVPVVFSELATNNGQPYVRSFPLMSIEESEGGYACVFQGFGPGEVQGGTPFTFYAPKH